MFGSRLFQNTRMARAFLLLATVFGLTSPASADERLTIKSFDEEGVTGTVRLEAEGGVSCILRFEAETAEFHAMDSTARLSRRFGCIPTSWTRTEVIGRKVRSRFG
ncbi:MAG: hypothetical protein U1D30_22215 [Planctomycetota bacterium]